MGDERSGHQHIGRNGWEGESPEVASFICNRSQSEAITKAVKQMQGGPLVTVEKRPEGVEVIRGVLGAYFRAAD